MDHHMKMEMGALLLISAPGGSLSYEDHDIVVCQEASIHPGRRVAENALGQWQFVYITDRTCMETMPLMEQQRSSEVESDDDTDPDKPGLVSKRRYCCVLAGDQAKACATYRPLSEAPAEQRMTWKEFENSFCVDKDA